MHGVHNLTNTLVRGRGDVARHVITTKVPYFPVKVQGLSLVNSTKKESGEYFLSTQKEGFLITSSCISLMLGGGDVRGLIVGALPIPRYPAPPPPLTG